MRAILINPIERTITETEIGQGANKEYNDLKKLLDDNWIERFRYYDHYIWVDEEGLLKETNSYWSLPGRTVLAGKGVVTGPEDEEGYSTECLLSIETLAQDVKWLDITRKDITLRTVNLPGLVSTTAHVEPLDDEDPADD